MSYIGNFLYPLHSAIHWTPRVNELNTALALLDNRANFKRIIDIGCGHGLLCQEVLTRKLNYIGIDTCEQLITIARNNNPDHTFYCSSAEELPFDLSFDDIAVLNGVVHHLNENVWLSICQSLKQCGAVIVLDHRRDEEFDKQLMLIPRFLQWGDRGNYIRNLDKFESITGFSLIHKKLFDIQVLKIRMWPYFCYVYLNNNLHMENVY